MTSHGTGEIVLGNVTEATTGTVDSVTEAIKTPVVNVEQFNAWNGPEGITWAAHEGPPNVELYAHIFAAAAIGEDDRVLDIGCGTGRASRFAARQAPHGEVVGIDLSAPMLERARILASKERLTNVRFVQGDAQVYPFPEAEFDVAISEFGIMFFADPAAAFANIGRSIRPGGRLVFVCPGEMSRQDWYVVPINALLDGEQVASAPGVGCNIDPGQPGMFSLTDPEHIVDLLTHAGFNVVAPTSITVPMPFGRDTTEAAEWFLGAGPVRAILDHTGLSDHDARDRLIAALQPYEGPDGVNLRGDLWLVTATRG